MRQRVRLRDTRYVMPVALGTSVLLAGLPAPCALAETQPATTARPRPAAPAATVPGPKAANLAGLSVPCWSCPEAEKWPVAFRTNLDLLAPLGNGPANAGIFFKDFASPGGSRFDEATAALERRVEGPLELGKVLPPDDPLLLEAEPWCDQATMRYYPDFFALQGYASQLPNLLIPLSLARSWVARGLAQKDPARAMEDFRRAVRLGRLLRQEDAVVTADLAGLACIRHGAEGIHDLARRRGDMALALVAATVLGECAPQWLLTVERMKRVDLRPYVRKDDKGVNLVLPDGSFDAILELASSDLERRFRADGIITLGVIRVLGTKPQQEKALAALKALTATTDGRITGLATWNVEHPTPKKSLAELLAPVRK